MAPDRINPTEDNGTDFPRGVLHVALVAPDLETANTWKRKARLIRPPLWKGRVMLHVIVLDPSKSYNLDTMVLQAAVDLGFADANDIGLIGYPDGSQ